MVPTTPIIHLDMFSEEFRKGYDSAITVSAMRAFLDQSARDDSLDSVFVKIHKISAPMIEGLLSENLFCFIFKSPSQVREVSNEVWMQIRPSKGRSR